MNSKYFIRNGYLILCYLFLMIISSIPLEISEVKFCQYIKNTFLNNCKTQLNYPQIDNKIYIQYISYKVSILHLFYIHPFFHFWSILTIHQQKLLLVVVTTQYSFKIIILENYFILIWVVFQEYSFINCFCSINCFITMIYKFNLEKL